jgi:hypothetical protein
MSQAFAKSAASKTGQGLWSGEDACELDRGACRLGAADSATELRLVARQDGLVDADLGSPREDGAGGHDDVDPSILDDSETLKCRRGVKADHRAFRTHRQCGPGSVDQVRRPQEVGAPLGPLDPMVAGPPPCRGWCEPVAGEVRRTHDGRLATQALGEVSRNAVQIHGRSMRPEKWRAPPLHQDLWMTRPPVDNQRNSRTGGPHGSPPRDLGVGATIGDRLTAPRPRSRWSWLATALLRAPRRPRRGWVELRRRAGVG